MISSFKQYLVEEEKVVYFAFGKMNPPTIDHGQLLDSLSEESGKNPYRMYTTQSVDESSNPLGYTDKVKHARRMFPKHARSIMINKGINNPVEAASALYAEGFRKIVMCTVKERVNYFDVLLNKYNGDKYHFESIKVVPVQMPDPDTGNMLRESASDGNFTAFSQGLPKSVGNREARALYNDVRKGLGLNEEKSFKRHIELMPVSDLRESYVKKELFDLGDRVVINKSGIVGDIQHLGPNYVIVESKGERWRCWLDDVAKVDEDETPKYEKFNEAVSLNERTLTPKEKKKREEVAKAIERDNPNMPMAKKMAIATATAKKVAEEKTDRWYKHQPEWGTPESTEHAKAMSPSEKSTLSRAKSALRKRRNKK